MKRPLLGTALMMGGLAIFSATTPALAADGCTDGLDRLGQQIAALEAASPATAAPGTPAPVTPQEIAQLRALQQAGGRVPQTADNSVCMAILGEAAALRESIAHPRAVAADDLAKVTLQGGDGSDLGKISELVIDPNSGRVAYAVVEMGGFLGIGDAHVPVPWALFQPSPNNDGYVLNLPKERLTGAPRFSGTERPNMGDRQWAMAVHTYYGVSPYWMRDSATLAAAGGSVGVGGQPPAQLEQEVQRLSQEAERLTDELTKQTQGVSGSTGAGNVPAGQSVRSSGPSDTTQPASDH